MQLSKFATKFTQKTGILQLMDDLGNALTQGNILMLGGGNPAQIPAVVQVWRNRMLEILQNNKEYTRMLGNYTTPQGDEDFIQVVAKYLHTQYGWTITKKNVSILNGGQTAFFFLLNMFAGEYPGGKKRKILFPLVPEYIGYADQGIQTDTFVGTKPNIEYLDHHTFKYRINFDALNLSDEIGGICLSRPTNPTGNVITDEELTRLLTLAKKQDIPLLIDNAYGAPFPDIIYTEAKPCWDEQIVFVFSLSKIGLPSTRTAIVIAREEIIASLSRINAIVSLATGTVGQHLVMPLLTTGELARLSAKMIRPYYQARVAPAISCLQANLADNLPYYLHKVEGAFFLWLWCKDLPITAQELYQRLKQRGVLVVPGNYFFPGLQERWKHTSECIRITYSQREDDVLQGLKIIGEEVRQAYG